MLPFHHYSIVFFHFTIIRQSLSFFLLLQQNPLAVSVASIDGMAAGAEASMDVLPNDMVEEVLRRVPLPGLAAARCACIEWRAAVDGLGLLGPHVLPHSLTGIFINYFDRHRPRFLARRLSSPRIDSALDLIPDHRSLGIRDLCNGLLLCEDAEEGWFVCNPATRRRARLPPRPGPPRRSARTDYLAVDPAASLHYHVVMFPDPEGFEKPEEARGPAAPVEWPPSLFKMRVFSSRTWRWEEREFVREGDAVVTLPDVLSEEGDSFSPEPSVRDYMRTDFCWDAPRRRNAVYWRGALYVHCRGDFLTKLSLSHDKYQVIKTPRNLEGDEDTKSYLGRSEKGVYYSLLDERQLWVWILDESSGPMEWILKYQIDLNLLAWQIEMLEKSQNWQAKTLQNMRNKSAWILDDDNVDDGVSCSDSEDKGSSDDDSDDTQNNDGNVEWNSDDDYILDVPDMNMGSFSDGNLFLLGFHPFKEVVFLGTFFSAVACHLRDSKAQYLGSLLPRLLLVDNEKAVGVLESFPYAPCLIDLLPGND